MKPELHSWIAAVLIILTIKIFFPKQQFHGLDENEDETVMFLVNWVAPILSFAIALYLIL